MMGKVLYHLTKSRARSEVYWTEDESDPWFLYEYSVEKKSRKVSHASCFIAKDAPSLISQQVEGGWLLEVIQEPTEESARYHIK
jgi:hypothetical protein